MSQDPLAEAISKNLEIIKQETKHETDEQSPDEILSRAPKLGQPRGDFDFSANRLFLDDVYFRNSKLIRMYPEEYYLTANRF